MSDQYDIPAGQSNISKGETFNDMNIIGFRRSGPGPTSGRINSCTHRANKPIPLPGYFYPLTVSVVRLCRGARGWRLTWSAKPGSWSKTCQLKGGLSLLIRCHGGFDSYCSPPQVLNMFFGTGAADDSSDDCGPWHCHAISMNT